MAELGVINTRDVHGGYRAPDRSAEARAIGRALGGAQEVIKGAILGGVEDDITSDLASRVEDLAKPTPEEMGPPEADTEASALRTRVTKLVRQRDQGNSSQKALAQMQIKQTIADASVKYPWLREELLQRAGQLSQISIELDRLGLYDAALEAQAQQASSQLEQMRDHALKDWDEGGLGIDPSIPIDSPEWARQYTDRQQLRAADTTRQMMLSVRELDATNLLETAGSMFQGRLSGARSAIEGIYQRNGLYAAVDAAMRGEQGDPEVLRQFKQVGAQLVVADLQQLNIQATATYENLVAPKYRGTEDGKIFKAMLDDFITQNNKTIQLTQDMANGVPGAAAHLDSLRAVRSANMYRNNTEPFKNYEAWLSDPGRATMLEVASGDISASGEVFRQQVASTATKMLSNYNPTIVGPNASPAEQAAMSYITSGQNAIGKGATPGEVIEILEKTQRDSDTPFYVPGGSSRQDQIGAATTIELHSELWRKAKEVDSQASPYKAATFATGITYGLLGLSKETNRPSDLDEFELSNLASDDLTELVEVMGDGEYTGQRRALGMAMKDYYTSTNPDERRKLTLKEYNDTKIGATPLSSIALIDVRKMSDEGIISYKEDKTALAREVDARLQQARVEHGLSMADQIPSQAPNRTKIENQVRVEIAEVMEPIVAHVQQDLNIQNNMRLAVRPVFERNEGSLRARFFDELGWLDGFNYTTAKD